MPEEGRLGYLVKISLFDQVMRGTLIRHSEAPCPNAQKRTVSCP